MLFYRAIDSKTLELLKEIQRIDLFRKLRLVGGTSLALQLGHRISVDLDFFGELKADRMNIMNELQKIGELKSIHYTDNINIFTLNGIKVDIVNYSYPWLEPIIKQDNLGLADIKDIAAMKLAAITGRGSKKDFIDLYFLLNRSSFEEMLGLYQNKYADGSVFLVLKSLAYFDDADEDPMPILFEKLNWDKVKLKISETLKTYIEKNKI